MLLQAYGRTRRDEVVDHRVTLGGSRRGLGPQPGVDVGCGVGWSTIALARAFPAATVAGSDLDQAAVDDASARGEIAGAVEEFTPFTLLTVIPSTASTDSQELKLVPISVTLTIAF